MEIKITLKQIIVTILLVVAVFFGVKYAIDKYETKSVSYTFFLSEIESKNISYVKIMEDGRSIEYTSKKNKEYQLVSPVDVGPLLPTLIQNNVKVDAAPPVLNKGLSFWTMLLIAIIPVLMIIGALIWFGNKNKNDMLGFKESNVKMIEPELISVSMGDVITSDGELDEAKEIIDYLKNQQKYIDTGAKFPKGILLSGPPGTGKTMMAKAIAKEAGIPFFYASGSEFVEMFVGVGAARVRDMFKLAREHERSIIFIDEIDAMGNSRSDHGNQEHDQTLNQLLVEMDGMDENSNILLIGASNRVDMLDEALVRPGRFDRIIHVSLPDLNSRKKILDAHSKTVKFNKEAKKHLGNIAKATSGYSGAELANLINESAMNASKHNKKTVTKVDLEVALDKISLGAAAPKKMSEKELTLTAVHEAGHAIVGYCSPEHDNVYKVSIIPRGNALGITAFVPEEDRYSYNKSKLISMITTLMAGRAAEEIVFGEYDITSGASSDIQRATRIAKSMITEFGFSKMGIVNFVNEINKCSEVTKREIDLEVIEIINNCHHQAKEILKSKRKELDEMTASLKINETIDLSEIVKIMGARNV